MKGFKTLILTGLLGLILLSCATPPFTGIDGEVAAENYGGALSLMEKSKKDLYDKDDAILYQLDAGMLNHFAGEYDESITLLQEGERGIEAAFTKSVTEIAGSLINNDTSKSYGGEDYEDVYINTFNALNYYHKNQVDEAAVEIRRMNEKLAYLSDKYYEVGVKLQEEADKKDKVKQKALKEAEKTKKAAIKDARRMGIVLMESEPPEPELPGELVVSKYANSALGRYLGMLFFRAIGNGDDARIDRDWLKAAFANAPELYNFPLPSSIETELAVPPGKARLNVLAFGGLSPIKNESVSYIDLGGGNHIKIALPEMQFRPSAINRIEIAFDNGKAYRLEKLESIAGVANETFQEKLKLIKLRTTLRATIKGVAAKAASTAGKAMQNNSNSNVALAGAIVSLVGAIGQVAGDVSEKADLRVSRYFPSDAYVTGITLDPGTYSVTVSYYDAAGGVIGRFAVSGVRVEAGKLNLVETACLK